MCLGTIVVTFSTFSSLDTRTRDTGDPNQRGPSITSIGPRRLRGALQPQLRGVREQVVVDSASTSMITPTSCPSVATIVTDRVPDGGHHSYR